MQKRLEVFLQEAEGEAKAPEEEAEEEEAEAPEAPEEETEEDKAEAPEEEDDEDQHNVPEEPAASANQAEVVELSDSEEAEDEATLSRSHTGTGLLPQPLTPHRATPLPKPLVPAVGAYLRPLPHPTRSRPSSRDLFPPRPSKRYRLTSPQPQR